MTLAWCAIAFVSGAFSLLAVQSVASAVKRRRLPVQVIAGHVFPHPQDEAWKVTASMAHMGDVIIRRRSLPHSVGTFTQLGIGDIVCPTTIASGKCVERYLCAIEAAHESRMVAKALEKLS